MISRNSVAQEAARNLIRRALQVLNDMLRAGQIGRQLVQKIKIEPPSTITMPSEYRPDWSIACFRVQMDLEKASAFKEFEHAVEQDSHLGSRMNTPIGTSSQRRRMTCCDFFQILLMEVLQECDDNLEISNEQFDSIWKFITLLLVADRTQIKYWTIIENVEVPFGSTEILPGILIRGLSTRELEELWNQNKIIQDYYPFYSISGSSILNVQTILETTVDEEVVVGESEIDSTEALSRFGSIQSSFISICTSIRLLRPERIIMSPVIVEVADVWASTSAHGSLDWRVGPYVSRCKLSQDDINEIQRLLKVISPSGSGLSRSIMVCLRRISFANTRLSLEDRLLDTFMALEALVLSDSGAPKERGELSFRLAIRMAKFLEHTREGQLEIYELLRAAYRLRSKVIHGGQLEPKETNIISDLERLTRDAARKYLYAIAEGNSVDWTNLLFD